MNRDGGIFVCAGRGEEFDFAQSIGVGLIESAIGLSRICERQKPKYIIFIGSAGSYNMKAKILDLYISDYAFQIETSLINHLGYTPLQEHISGISTKKVSHETYNRNSILKKDIYPMLHSLPSAKVNSSNYITKDENMAKQLYAQGMMLENMEFFTVMKVAQIFGIDAMGVFCISNYCNNWAHQDFIKNHNAVKKKLENLFCSLD